MPAQQHPNIDIAIRYHRAVAEFATGDDLAVFFHPEATHHELPNALFPDGNTRDLPALCAASAAGRKTLSSQSFEVRNAIAMDNQVALEVLWTGTTAIPLGDLPAGHTLRAHIAAILEFRDGKIVAQRNYDCYERLTPVPE
ncbi:nuclear transport factor 2 family protein [Nocardia crassostreae]|uniref:nuclear transport factor 2 family protein n=1 Tax=Nocardia crassostreae TaxID=53428 RepID=UPI00082B9E72|nr:nuclear transport factor 2 family protein [Nocardia crassostreae]